MPYFQSVLNYWICWDVHIPRCVMFDTSWHPGSCRRIPTVEWLEHVENHCSLVKQAWDYLKLQYCAGQILAEKLHLLPCLQLEIPQLAIIIVKSHGNPMEFLPFCICLLLKIPWSRCSRWPATTRGFPKSWRASGPLVVSWPLPCASPLWCPSHWQQPGGNLGEWM